MREILFRGKWRGKEWVYGNYEYYHKPEKHIISDFYTQDTYGIDKNTLGQYTGLTDKNGTKIFEGDVVKVYDLDNYVVIEWDNDTCRFTIIEQDTTNIVYDFDNYYGEDLEVIGNIYDNPELLEGYLC